MPTEKRIDAPGVLWPQRYRIAILRASNTRAAIDHIATTIIDDVQVERLAEASVALVELEKFLISEANDRNEQAAAAHALA